MNPNYIYKTHQYIMSGEVDEEMSIPPDMEEDGETKNQSSEENLTGKGGKLSVQVITKYMCRYCARQFDSPTEMQAHIATHARGKSNTQCHTCYVCGKTYSTPSKLQRHVRVHSGERPYSCNICGRRFTRSDHVKQHLKVHMPQKQRNTCRVCGMKFLRRQALHSHLQQSHGVSQVYTCHRCGEAFDRVEKLHQHKNSHLNADAQAVVPIVMEGGIVVKKEPAKTVSNQDESSNYVVGLAKFSLGPQPQIYEEIAGGHSSVTISQDDSASNLDIYQEDMEENSEEINNEVGATNTECNMEISSCYSLADNSTKIKTENFEDGNPSTVTDGEQMYILTPENIQAKVKQEKQDDEEYGIPSSTKSQNQNGGKNQDEVSKQTIKTENVNGDNDKKESHDQCEQANFDSDDDESSKEASPKSGPSTHKIKILGPASYKAAMRNKIQMNFPGARNRSLRSQESSVLGYTNINKGSSSQMLLRSSSAAQKNSTATSTATVPYGKKLSRCEHCCIWFEDYTMCMLHNSLHSADDSDPFTCRKCLKKLGNRLEFTAHLVWHLEPDIDN